MLIGQKLRKIRELHDYTEKHVAEKLGLSLSQYSKIERNESSLTLERLTNIGKIYNFSAIDILCWNEKDVFANCKNANILQAENQENKFTNEGHKALFDQLKSEINFLKSENARLWELVKLKAV